MKTSTIIMSSLLLFTSSAVWAGFDGERMSFSFKVLARDKMLGFDRTIVEFEGCEGWVVEPKTPADDGRWVWCMEWPTAFQERTGVKAFLDAGYRWVAFNPAYSEWIKVVAGNQNDEMVAKRHRWQQAIVKTLKLAPKCGLIGMSWGGYYSVRYASIHPECVNAIYLDAPLLDFSTLKGYAENEWKELSNFYPFATADYKGADDPFQSVNRAASIAEAKIPLFVLYGGQDTVVPPEKNIERFAPAFKKAGGDLTITRRGSYAHHPHGLEESEAGTIVGFFEKAFGLRAADKEASAAPIPPDNETYLFKTMANPFPKIRKVGAVSPNGEVSPFVWKGRLYRMELFDEGRDVVPDAYKAAVIRDVETGKIVGRTGEECFYHSICVEGDVVYLTGVKRNVAQGEHSGDTILIYETTDLVNWTKRELLRNPGWRYYNSTLTKGPDGYVIAVESSDLRYATKHFTMFFATSKDMKTWTFLPNEKAYPKHRYCGGPFLRYCNGWYYLSLVTEMPCERWCTYLFRTKDFSSWECGRYNPFMMWSEEDRHLAPNAADITPEFAHEIETHFVCSASDLEMCEFRGKTVIDYLVGDQRGFYYTTEAIYDGPMQELLERQFE